MDNKTNIHELKEIVNKFVEDRDWGKFHSPKELSIGIITEASELLEKFRFKSDKEIEELLNSPNKKEEISEEIADVLYFLLRFSHLYDIDLSTAMKDKIKKNELRYPIEKSKGSNKKYNEL